MKPYIALARPKHWVKNLFLYAPLVFSKHLFEEGYLWTETVGFVVFCLISSVVYVVNDIADRETDRLHPVKRSRPVASGAVTIPRAIFYALSLLILATFLSISLPPSFQFIAVIYLVLNVAYSFRLKQLILIDVFIVAAGFMLRVLAGAFVIDVEVSHWLVLCTLFVSLFLAISKRRGELFLVQTSTEFSGRQVLREYDVAFVDQMMTIAAAGMAISYALYTVAERTVTTFKTENLIFTTVFVLFGIFRYLYLVKRNRTDDNPTSMLISDPVMMINVAAWFVSCVFIIYFNEIRGWL